MREIEWKPPEADPNDTVWQSNQNLESVLGSMEELDDTRGNGNYQYEDDSHV